MTGQERAPSIRKRFVRVGEQLIHYRTAGSGAKVVLLHDSPRSSRLYANIIPQLAQHFEVYALDTPGYGNSSPLPAPTPTIGDFAAFLGCSLDALGLTGAPIYARHTSAKIALEYGVTCTRPPARLILDGLAIRPDPPDEVLIRSYMQHCVIDEAGSFLAFEWMRIRDMIRWFPWFDRRFETRTHSEFPPLGWLEPYVIDVLSAGRDYASAYAAAMRYDPVDALRRIKIPTLVAARSDDVLYSSLDLLPRNRSSVVESMRLPPDDGLWLQWLIESFKEVAGDPEELVQAVPAGPGDPIYIDHAGGQILVHRDGARRATRPLLILDAPTIMHAQCWRKYLAPHRQILIPELPGFGESDPLRGASLAEISATLCMMLDRLAIEKVDMLACGFSAPLALALAGNPARPVEHLIIDGAPDPLQASQDTRQNLFPFFDFEPSAAHLYRIWHYLRDGECQWPWYDASRAAQCATDPVLDGPALYQALLGILKQPRHYGDAAWAGLTSDMTYEPHCRRVTVLDVPNDPVYAAAPAMAARLPMAELMRRPTDRQATASLILSILDEKEAGGDFRV